MSFNIEIRQDIIRAMMPETLTYELCINIEKAIGAAVSGKGDRLVLDFAELAHINSTYYGLLIRLYNKIQDGGGTFCLVNVSETIRSVLNEVGLHNVFDIYATDVEFETSCNDASGKKSWPVNSFFFISNTEDDICWMIFSGSKDVIHDLSGIRNFQPPSGISKFIFNLDCLEIIDTAGIQIFFALINEINKRGGRMAAFGSNPFVKNLLITQSASTPIRHFPNQSGALHYVNQGLS